MKYLLFILTLFLLMCEIACRKVNAGSGISSVNIVNANANVTSLDVYQSLWDSAFYLYQSPISFGSSLEYGMPSGSSPLTLVNAADTGKPLFQGTLHLVEGKIYSLYLIGQYPSIDTLFSEDFISEYYDSVAGVRFVNLSTGSAPMSVNLVGNSASQVEFSGLAYKFVSSFKTYPDTNAIESYNFEVRDEKTGNLLTTYSWNFTIFKNNTLVICGSGDSASSTPINVFSVNNF